MQEVYILMNQYPGGHDMKACVSLDAAKRHAGEMIPSEESILYKWDVIAENTIWAANLNATRMMTIVRLEVEE